MDNTEQLFHSYKVLESMSQPLFKLKETRSIFSIDSLEKVVQRMKFEGSCLGIYYKLKENDKVIIRINILSPDSIQLMVQLPGQFKYEIDYDKRKYEFKLILSSNYDSEYVLILEGNSRCNIITYSWKGGITYAHLITPEIIKELNDLQEEQIPKLANKGE